MIASGPRFLTSSHYEKKAAAPSAATARRQALEDSKRSFLRMVSHELRTPLNSIIGFSEIISCELHGPISDPRYREHAEIIRDSGQKLLRLVNQIMEIARLEAGAADLDIRPEIAPAAADEVFQMLEHEASQRRIALRLETVEPLPMVLADARGLKTILFNLIQNAVTYSPEGGEILVTLRRRRQDLSMEVCDQGVGIPPKDITRVMRPFEQGDSALTRRAQGAGLGLPIVKLLCDAMGGRLRLQAAPGGGLLASVRLPIACADETAAA